jgi:hypothetical protein
MNPKEIQKMYRAKTPSSQREISLTISPKLGAFASLRESLCFRFLFRHPKSKIQNEMGR